MREPFRLTPRDYAEASDWQILNVLFAARDDDFRLVTIKRRIADAFWKRQIDPAVYTTPPPSVTAMQVPPEALALMPERMTQGYIAMFWQTWSRRGLTAEQVLARWRDYAAKGFN